MPEPCFVPVRRLATPVFCLALLAPRSHGQTFDLGAERRAASHTLAQKSAPEQIALAAKLARERNPVAGFTVVLDCVLAVDAREEAARARRDAQGARLHAFHLGHRDETGVGPEWKVQDGLQTWRTLLAESQTLNVAVAESAAVARAFREAACSLSADGALDAGQLEQQAAAWRAAAQPQFSTSRRAALLRAIGSALARTLAGDLDAIVTSRAERDERVAALDALARGRVEPGERAAKAALGDPDPQVRRRAADALAAVGSAPAVELLLAQLERESGPHARRIGGWLAMLSGRPVTLEPAAWRAWWAEARAGWSSPAEAPQIDAEPEDALDPEHARWFGLAVSSKRVVFVIDLGASMLHDVNQAPSPLPGVDLPVPIGVKLPPAGRTKAAIVRAELARALAALPEDASFAVVAYGTKVHSPTRRLVPAAEAHVERALRFVDELEPAGGGNLSGALLDALEATQAGARPVDLEIADTILLVAGSLPSCGPIPRAKDLQAELARRHEGAPVTLHTICLGLESDPELLRQLAAATGGRSEHRTE